MTMTSGVNQLGPVASTKNLRLVRARDREAPARGGGGARGGEVARQVAEAPQQPPSSSSSSNLRCAGEGTGVLSRAAWVRFLDEGREERVEKKIETRSLFPISESHHPYIYQNL